MSVLVTIGLSIGLQQLNVWLNNKQREKLEQAQREARAAAQKHEFERARAKQEEAHRIALEMEREAHIERRKDIEKDYDTFFKSLAKDFQLKAWPLNVVPFIMKGESFGTHIHGHDAAAVNCLLTPSDDCNFNKKIYPRLDLQIERAMNSHWGSNTDHTVVYYGGSWKKKTPNGNLQFEKADLDRLHAGLHQVPFLTITPHVSQDGKLDFQVWAWGMGAESRETITPPDDLLAKPLTKLATAADTEQAIASLSAYLVALIGYLTDIYYWRMYGSVPLLPRLIAKQQIALESTEVLSEDYKELIDAETEDVRTTLHSPEQLVRLVDLIKSTKQLVTPTSYQSMLESLFLCASISRGYDRKDGRLSFEDALDRRSRVFSRDDIPFLAALKKEHTLAVTKAASDKEPTSESAQFVPIQIEPINITTMDTQLYSQKRDELLSLVKKILKVDDLTQEERGRFSLTHRRLQENQFNIVIIGEFQGGKSTLFNSLCGGREISPRGAMTKTSAICITATNLADTNADEYAKIQWKTDAELLSTMGMAVGTITAEDLGVTLAEGEPFMLADHFSFDNPKHVKALVKALDDYSEFDADRGQREQIRIARIICKFYGDPSLKKLKAQKTFSVEDVAKYAVFPSCWEERWLETDPTFEPAEAVFAFIGRIDVHIHSKALGMLGCSITDCPGLFASAWDTSIAMEEMAKANAVIYLLGGERQMTEGDEKAIALISKRNELRDKIFYVLNEKKNNTVTQNVLSADNPKLTSLELTDFSIQTLNNLLYFLGNFGLAYCRGTLDDFSKKRFLEVARNNGVEKESVEDAWTELVSDIGVNVKKKELKAVDALTEETATLCLKESNSEQTFGSVEQTIVDKKANSILVDNGVVAIANTLDNVDARLKKAEDDARKSYVQRRHELEDAVNALEAFHNKVERILSPADMELIMARIAENAYMAEIAGEDCRKKIALKLAVELPKAINLRVKGNAVKKAFFNKVFSDTDFARENRAEAQQALDEVFSPVITQVVKEELEYRMLLWTTSLFEGNHPDFKKYLRPKMEKMAEKINDEWERTIRNVPSMESLQMNQPNIAVPSEILMQEFNLKDLDVADDIAGQMIKDIAEGVINYVIATTVALIGYWLIDAGLGGVLDVIAALYALGAYVYTRLGKMKNPGKKEINTRDDLKKKQKKFYDKIDQKLLEKFNEIGSKEKLVDVLKTFPDKIFKGFKSCYREQLNRLKKILNDDLARAMDNSEAAQRALLERAKHAKEVRKKKILPLKANIDDFIKSLG